MQAFTFCRSVHRSAGEKSGAVIIFQNVQKKTWINAMPPKKPVPSLVDLSVASIREMVCVEALRVAHVAVTKYKDQLVNATKLLIVWLADSCTTKWSPRSRPTTTPR